MTDQTLNIRVDNGVATLTLNRPRRYNSFTDELHAELKQALRRIAADDQLKCLVITGQGKGFCTGQDLNDRYRAVQQRQVDLGQSLQQNYNPLIQQLMDLKIPVIAAVNGVAAGAGISLAMACDIVIAVRSASFVFAFAKVGLIPDAGATWALVQSLGLPRARAIALLGATLSAEEAQHSGLIWQCVDDEALDEAVSDTVRRLLENPALGLALSKRALKLAGANQLHQQLALEAQLQTVAGRSGDYAEAVSAFVEKRPARFEGQ